MNLESLLLSQDLELVRILRPTLEKLSIDVEICQDAKAGTQILVSEKFDAVIVDCDDLKGGREILQGVRNTPSNRNAITFAILNGKKTTTQEVFGMGVNFVLQKPISALNAARCFNAALNFMVKERRRYFRQPVKMMVRLVYEDKELKATSTNVSEGGMALMMREALPKGVMPRLQFSLPDTSFHLDLAGEMAWTDLKGNVGFRFHEVPSTTQELLEGWLDERMEKEFPGSKERLAAEAAIALPR